METDVPVPPNVAPFVRVLGIDLTIKVLVELGGAELYIPASPGGGAGWRRWWGPI